MAGASCPVTTMTGSSPLASAASTAWRTSGLPPTFRPACCGPCGWTCRPPAPCRRCAAPLCARGAAAPVRPGWRWRFRPASGRRSQGRPGHGFRASSSCGKPMRRQPRQPPRMGAHRAQGADIKGRRAQRHRQAGIVQLGIMRQRDQGAAAVSGCCASASSGHSRSSATPGKRSCRRHRRAADRSPARDIRPRRASAARAWAICTAPDHHDFPGHVIDRQKPGAAVDA